MLDPELPLSGRPVDMLARLGLLDPIAEAIAPAVRALRDADPRFKSLISGTWLGHALHPLLTDVPIGAFTALSVLDAADLTGIAEVATAADLVLATGIAAGAATAVTGWSDWSDTAGAPRRLGLVHALLNGTALAGYSASFLARRTGRRRAGAAIAYAAFGCMGLAGYLGSELVSGMHLAVRHVAEPTPPGDEFTDVASEKDLEEDVPLAVKADGISVFVVRHGGKIYALTETCSHRGGPLRNGSIEDGCVRCPWHGSRFNLADGTVREGPATFPQIPYDVRVAGGRVAIRAPRG